MQSSDVTVFNLKLPFVQFSIYCYYILTLLYLIKACLVCSFNLCKKKRDAHFFCELFRLNIQLPKCKKYIYVHIILLQISARGTKSDRYRKIQLDIGISSIQKRFLFLDYLSNINKNYSILINCKMYIFTLWIHFIFLWFLV